MLKTLIYKFKKRELSDSPPDITATEDNWDIVERELKSIRDELTALRNASLLLDSIFDGSGDLNTATKLNKYYCIFSSGGVLNKPYEGGSLNNSTLYVYGQDKESFTQVLYASVGGEVWTRSYCGWRNPKWTSWKLISNNTQQTLSYELDYQTKSNKGLITKLKEVIAWLKR